MGDNGGWQTLALAGITYSVRMLDGVDVRDAMTETDDEKEDITKVDMFGCTEMAGLHSDEYGQPGGRCAWCGEPSPARDPGEARLPELIGPVT